jgi:hypothetical protein
MKSILLFVLVFSSVMFYGCDKAASPSPSPSGTSNCKLLSESTSLSGNEATYEYTYSADGNVTSIKKFIGGIYHVLADSTVVFYDHVTHYAPAKTPGTFNSSTISYNANIFTGLPTQADVSITIDGVEQRHYYAYAFSYDTKNRLIKISEQTPTVVNDWEYDLEVSYNDQDNVTALTYKATTGTNSVTVIAAAGYDDKPTPFAGIKNWPFMMRAGWTSSDPEPVFSALSKNNPLGYAIPGWKRTISYQYNDNGSPTKRINTNTTPTANYTFEENFGYQCK